MTMQLARRVARLEELSRAAQPLVVLVRAFTGGPHVCRITGPDGTDCRLEPGEDMQDFERRAIAGAREAIARCKNLPPIWPLHESRSLTARPWNKAEFTARKDF